MCYSQGKHTEKHLALLAAAESEFYQVPVRITVCFILFQTPYKMHVNYIEYMVKEKVGLSAHDNHSIARANLNSSKKSLDFYYHSIKVHTQEAKNLHSDPNLLLKYL